MKKAFLRGYSDPHRSLGVLSSVARGLTGVRVLRVPMNVPAAMNWGVAEKLLALGCKLCAHVLLAGRVARAPGEKVLVREFLTLPLLLCAPLLLRYRTRVWFLCQHNIAFAAQRHSHRWALRALRSIGFRFVVFENTSAWLVVEPESDAVRQGVIALRLPFPGAGVPCAVRDTDVSTVIGFVGNMRKEKSPLWALRAICRELGESGRLAGCVLLVATSDQGLLQEFSGQMSVRSVDTTEYERYHDALRSCDVVVLPYEPAAYRFRTSGVIADAVWAGCAVVAPDLPILREQVLYPSAIGATYSQPEGLVHAVKAAIALRQSADFRNALLLHHSLRGNATIAGTLNRL